MRRITMSIVIALAGAACTSNSPSGVEAVEPGSPLHAEVATLREQLIESGRDPDATAHECKSRFKWDRVNLGADYISFRTGRIVGQEQRIVFRTTCDIERIMMAWPYDEAICPKVGVKLGTMLPERLPPCEVKERRLFEWIGL